jgi:sigma-B regulation protein RsbU (phosphoserine phosphatase)
MMAWTERMLELRRAAIANQLAETAAAASDEEFQKRSSPAVQCDLTDSLQSLTDEVLALRREQARLQQAIFEAAQVQRRLCAPRELTWGEFEIAGEIFPVRHLSGDFFKVMEFGSALGLALGDIAGKGLTAGIWQAHVMGLIQRSARRHPDPSDAVADVNRELCLGGEPPMTALFFARIDARTNILFYCNAGLPAPLLLRGNKTLERLEEGGPMLGATDKAVFNTGSVTLNRGDMLVAHSDGATECRNPQDQEFEMERLAAAACAVQGVPANKALFSMLGAVLDFADTCSPGDDLTLLVVRRRGAIKSEQSRSRARDSSAVRRQPASVTRTKKSGDKVSNS